MKAKHKKALSIGIFLTIVLVIFVFLNSLFQPIWYSWGSINSAKGFYAEPKNRIETVFVGSSIAVAGITPTELYDDYGICSYNLSTVNQPTEASYYWVEEAYRLHPETLDTVVFDVSSLRSGAGESYYHKAYDYMRLSDVKLRAIKDYTNGDRKKMIEFLLPMAAYHSRWNDLNTSDLEYYTKDMLNGQRGYFFSDDFYESENVEEIEVASSKLDPADNEPMDEIIDSGVKYFNKMVEFCKEHDIELILTKLPTIRWESGLHNEVQQLADENDLEFVDYNFSPLYDEINYVFPFDCFDDHHVNYYGAHKITKLIGEYLVKNHDMTDVRELEEYNYMKNDSAEYDARIRQYVALNSTETVEEYLQQAINDDNTVFITVKGSAAQALSDEQREAFKKLGLDKLASIDEDESYLAMIEPGGKVAYEELQEASKGDEISKSGTFGDDIAYKLKSGGSLNGDTAYCQIRKTNYALNERGMNIVVYNHVIDEVINKTVFDTHAFRSRDTYSINKAAEVAALPGDTDVDLNSITGQILLYMQRERDFINGEELRASMDKNDAAAFIDEYIADSDNLIIVTCGHDISKILSDQQRAQLSGFGLSKLSGIEYGDSYVAMIDGGSIQREVLKSGDKAITIEERGLYIKSAGAYSGSTSSIVIDGLEYVTETKGLNIVVYDQADNRVVDHISF